MSAIRDVSPGVGGFSCPRCTPVLAFRTPQLSPDPRGCEELQANHHPATRLLSSLRVVDTCQAQGEGELKPGTHSRVGIGGRWQIVAFPPSWRKLGSNSILRCLHTCSAGAAFGLPWNELPPSPHLQGALITFLLTKGVTLDLMEQEVTPWGTTEGPGRGAAGRGDGHTAGALQALQHPAEPRHTPSSSTALPHGGHPMPAPFQPQGMKPGPQPCSLPMDPCWGWERCPQNAQHSLGGSAGAQHPTGSDPSTLPNPGTPAPEQIPPGDSLGARSHLLCGGRRSEESLRSSTGKGWECCRLLLNASAWK